MNDVNAENKENALPADQDKTAPDKTTDRVADFFSIPFHHEDDSRNWQKIEGLNRIPGLVKSKEYKQAYELIETYAPDFQDFDFIYAWQAQIYQKNKDVSHALEILKSGLEKARSKQLLCERMGFWYYEIDDLENAAKWWMKSIILICRYNADFLWEPFLYLSYVAGGCGCETESRVLMDIAASKHGHIVLKPEAEKALIQKASALKNSDIPKAVQQLCSGFSKPGQNPPGKKSDPSSIPTDNKSEEIMNRPTSFSALIFSRVGVAVMISFLLVGCLIIFFCSSNEEKVTPAIHEPAAAAPNVQESKKSRSKIQPPPNDQDHTEPKPETQAAAPSSNAPVPDAFTPKPPQQNPDPADDSLIPGPDINMPNKTRPSYLKQKTKQPASRLQKKQVHIN